MYHSAAALTPLFLVYSLGSSNAPAKRAVFTPKPEMKRHTPYPPICASGKTHLINYFSITAPLREAYRIEVNENNSKVSHDRSSRYRSRCNAHIHITVGLKKKFNPFYAPNVNREINGLYMCDNGVRGAATLTAFDYFTACCVKCEKISRNPRHVYREI